MANYRKDDMYDEDPTGKTIREIYDDIDKRKELRGKAELIEADKLHIFDTIFWEEDANYILRELGIDYRFNEKNVPEETISRLVEFYKDKIIDFSDEEAIPFDIDPAPNYVPGNGPARKELYTFGYTLGSEGQVGKYYVLLPNKDFAKGYFIGKFEKGINENDDNIILEVSKEIKVLDPEGAEKELSSIVEKCFSETEENIDNKPKTI
jgi:hypothetical protein